MDFIAKNLPNTKLFFLTIILGMFFGYNTSSISNKNKSNEEELLKLKNFFPAKEKKSTK